ncbi:glycoside hydrolase family 5 protein [Flavihumibacter petaseus]|uniref:Putative glycosidase n=1 Tax=Flavihumibacter petaseus NBRC 106054 TaxID=1220578 RepID=A0A0E9MZ56_9BACT|nr:cellulase family glycosylhydrolase [Flavihumibacter petaseus]GAO42375.1 putative glycosidase [Flavihumibacter petaseus NBRC 106054]
MDRRKFLGQSSLAAGALAVGSLAIPGLLNANTELPFTHQPLAPLPKWQGFNLLDFFIPDPARSPAATTQQQLTWIRDWGFNFIRIPIAYPWYLKFDRSRDITPEEVYQVDEARVQQIETLVSMGNEQGLHVSLNLHRAPGYCINAGFREPYHLWTDAAAQEAFYYHWNFWAKRFRSKTPAQISFDLVNEPSMRKDLNDQHSASGPVPGEYYKKVATGALAAIRKENPAHLVIADGNNVGNDPIPELIGTPIGQSCRGYYPHAISHYKAPWANKEPEKNPLPVWPGKIGDTEYSRASLEKYYQPWLELKKKGVGVHCGECGCWNKTPHDVFLNWFGDLTGVLNDNGIGFALWNFIGDFGLLNSGRADVDYVDFHGYKLDHKLLDLLKKRQ